VLVASGHRRPIGHPASVRRMKGRARGARVRRLLLCLGLGALAPLGSIRVSAQPQQRWSLDGERFFVPGQRRRIAEIDADAGFPPPIA
jgi:hypothetical protein